MWQRFTERARNVVFYAQEEKGLARRVLSKLGADLQRTREEIRQVQERDAAWAAKGADSQSKMPKEEN